MQFQLVRAALAVLALNIGCMQHTRPPARAAKRTSVTRTSSAQQALQPAAQPKPQRDKDAGRPSEPEMLDVDDAAFWLPTD